jgi:hypothetical protein
VRPPAEAYRRPATFADRGGAVPNPDPHPRPGMQMPPGMEGIFSMSDRELAERISFPTPPVPKHAAG